MVANKSKSPSILADYPLDSEFTEGVNNGMTLQKGWRKSFCDKYLPLLLPIYVYRFRAVACLGTQQYHVRSRSRYRVKSLSEDQ